MLGVIADDLTGAAELGAIGLRLGLRAEILLRPFNSARPFHPRPGLLCLDTDSRSCSAAEASRRAAAAARFLRKAGATFIYKKTDSVLRGQVTAEIQSIMGALQLEAALLVPANPSLGRTIRNGHYFIHGRPIDKTDFSRDPVHPRNSSLVTELLSKPKSRRIFICNPHEALPPSGITIGNATTPDHLQQWASQASPRILAAGGAEFFAALLHHGANLRKHGAAAGKPCALSERTPQFFVCGSTSQSTQQFIAAQRKLGTPLFSLPPELARSSVLTGSRVRQIATAAIAALRSSPRILLHVGLPLLRHPAVAKNLSVQLVRIAALVLKRAPVGHVFVEGGATAVELVRAMRVRRLMVLNELAPGVATLAVDSKLLLTMKPGSYRWPF